MRIIISDHHVQPRNALKALLNEHSEFNLIGEAENAQGLLVLAENNTSDLILLDGDLPGSSMDILIPKLNEIKPKPIVIVMSSKNENSRKLLLAGADAFVSKGNAPDWLLDILWKYERRVNNKE